MTALAPPFPYYGGKQRIAERIVDLFPPHEHYLEPFAGGLSVLFAKRPSRMETVSDKDRALMTFWRVLRDRPDELARACALTPHARAAYVEALSLYTSHLTPTPAHDLEIARRVFTIFAQGRASKTAATSWRMHVDPSGSSLSLPGYLRAYVARMAALAERLQNVTLETLDAVELIDRYAPHRGVLIYADPPYLASSRNSRGYRNEMGSEAEHTRLAEQLCAAKASVVLSGYRSPLYDRLYRDWDRVEIPSGTAQGGVYGPRTEVVWSNRTISSPDLLEQLKASRPSIRRAFTL
ncbi:DNA adenine methylase [Demequina sp. TTPB684]|uniref:DNA adenine methylase n=1 Tax=unclassified Demequina TaxID=2620311 RepID=UPI001CF1B954|nr:MULTISPECIES: DNA adenine methylase [unclassified Demequina]MCB2413670.1 DNA adenine methylase [Demequina sp. TTPB684]UPU87732.1 DNA adenine methylase [Demequina sp. TMPB413]